MAYSFQSISRFSSMPVQPVEQPLDGPQHGIEKRLLARENARHEDAERLRHGQEHDEKQSDLQPTVRSHG